MYIAIGHTLIGKIGWSIIVPIAATIVAYLINKTSNFIALNPFTIDVALLGGDVTEIQFQFKEKGNVLIYTMTIYYLTWHNNIVLLFGPQ